MKFFDNPDAVLLIDFDRTLFDTSQFVEWLWVVIADKYGIDPEVEKTRAQDFYSYSGDWYDYQFFTHLETIPEIARVDREEFINQIHSTAHPSFLFEDTREVIGACTEIITFGNKPYQEFKLALCPEVEGIPVRIIQESKADYIAKHYTQPLMLVDDKHLEDELPEWVHFVLIDRLDAEPLKRYRGNFVAINSLEKLKLL